MTKKLLFITTAIVITMGTANATILLTSDVADVTPTVNFITPPDSTTGTFTLSITGTSLPATRSPYENTAIPDTPYTVISYGGNGPGALPGSATYNCPGCNTLNVLWGSPDAYNSVSFFDGLNGTGTLLASFLGTDIVPPGTVAFGNNQVSFSGDYNSVVFADSGQAAFEYSNLSAIHSTPVNPVPGPIIGAGLPGLLGLLGFAGWKRREWVRWFANLCR